MDSAPLRRRRPALSCLECRRRKIKCDRQDPCAHCVTTKTKCSYKINHGKATEWLQTESSGISEDARIVPPRQGGLNSYPRSGLEHGDGPIRIETATVETEHGNTADSNSVDVSDRHKSCGRSRNTESAEHNVQIHSRLARELKESSSDFHNHGISETNQDGLVLRPELRDAQISLDKARVIRWSQWVGATQEFERMIAFYTACTDNSDDSVAQDDEIAPIIASVRDLLLKCKGVARMIKVGRPSRRLLHAGFSLVPPLRGTADSLVELYFTSFESLHRILHIPTFWSQYKKFWVSPEVAPTSTTLKILLVMGIGASLAKPEVLSAETWNAIHQWVYASEVWLSGPLEKDRLDLNGLQIHCLTILARQFLSIGGDLVWMSMGSLIHKAVQMGLHRDPVHFPSVTLVQAELRRRIWATILEMTVQSALDAGMPARISLAEFDTRPPSNVDDNDLAESTASLPQHPRHVYTSTSMQLILLDSLPARLRVVELLNGVHSELSYLDVLALSSEITAACRTSNDILEACKNPSVTPFHRNMLDCMVRRFLLPLHCPFASQARKNPLFSYSLTIGLESAMVIMSPEPDEAYLNLRAVGGGSFKEMFRSACTAISLALLAQVETQRLDGTLQRNTQYREMLKQKMKDLISFSVERIQRGETNVKSHLFLNMALAQVEAVETGTSSESKIAQSAKSSLEICHNLLNTQACNSESSYANASGYPLFTPEEGSYSLDLYMDFFLSEPGLTW